ncbi:unnamed protein product [Ectocarpus sp. 6 AP-2014]
MACPKSSTSKVCAPCEGGSESGLNVYTTQELEKELASLPLWTSTPHGDFIVRSFVAKNFVSAMAFLNEVATVAEEQGHHPDLHLTQYRNVEIRLQTHSMGGVTQNDIAEARLFDQLPVTYSPKWQRENLPDSATPPTPAPSTAPSSTTPS